MHKTNKVLYFIVMAHNQSPIVLQPSKQTFYLPTSPVASQTPAVLSRSLSPVVSVRSYHLYSLLCQLFIQWVTVIGFISYQMLRPLKCDFMRPSRRRVDGDRKGDRKTRALCHRHELRTFAPLGLSHSKSPPFLLPQMCHL
jgi:hypothetical protein